MSDEAMELKRGAAWRIWDLHVHTPASFVQGYGGDNEETWERYLDELERLPSEIGVIGVNDYWFLEGYERLVEAKHKGRLKNVDAIFPVIEMRLDQFGGTDGNLSRVNLHVIFDPLLSASTIRAQFISALQSKLKLTPGRSDGDWDGVVTRESIEDLGRAIKRTVPKDQLGRFGSDLQEGFNNLNVSLSDVQDILRSTYFLGRTLMGLGKTEWANIKWNSQSIASKKNVINSADFVFTAYEDASRWRKDVENLKQANVTHRILDCSDAHYFSDSNQHMKLGACQTWLNTTPTFAGLAYALSEFERRVFVGLEPQSLARVRATPEHFIREVTVASDTSGHDTFDYSLPLNPGFVAVVGNKGQGKSALLDCIALAGNSSRNDEFAFLTPKRFLNSANRKRAKEYHSRVEWNNGKSRQAKFDAEYDKSAPVYVEYLPQAFVERVCSVDPTTGNTDEFERELRAILFTHIEEKDRAGEKSFDGLLSQKSRSSNSSLERLRDELRNAVRDYCSLARFRSENTLVDVDARLELREAELVAARSALVEEKSALSELDTSSSTDEALEDLRTVSAQLDSEIDSVSRDDSANQKHQALLRQKLEYMKAISASAEATRLEVMELATEAGDVMNLDGDSYLFLQVNSALYDTWRITKEEELRDSGKQSGVINARRKILDAQRAENADALAKVDGARERARRRVMQAEERESKLVGTPLELESLEGLKALRAQISAAPKSMDDARLKVFRISQNIHETLESQLAAVSDLFEPASRFIYDAEVLRNAGLEFSADLRILSSWQNLGRSLDGRRNGDGPEWLGALPQRVEDTRWESLFEELEEAAYRLEHEKGDVTLGFRDPSKGLRAGASLEDYLVEMFGLTWLEVRFGLTGEGLPLSLLSPGQRGLVLALFYLVVDRRTTPLLLDQPEENLDNATIASKLVPAIHEAAGRRQTIVVTHNANLAIVGDADQIVHCQFDKDQFRVDSGSIAAIDVAQFALNVLEGTKPAFDNRRQKYEAFPTLV